MKDLLEKDDGLSPTVTGNAHGKPDIRIGDIPAREEPAGKEANESCGRCFDQDLEPTKRRWRVLQESLEIADEPREGGDAHPGGKFRDGIGRILVHLRSHAFNDCEVDDGRLGQTPRRDVFNRDRELPRCHSRYISRVGIRRPARGNDGLGNVGCCNGRVRDNEGDNRPGSKGRVVHRDLAGGLVQRDAGGFGRSLSDRPSGTRGIPHPSGIACSVDPLVELGKPAVYPVVSALGRGAKVIGGHKKTRSEAGLLGFVLVSASPVSIADLVEPFLYPRPKDSQQRENRCITDDAECPIIHY